MDNIVIQQKTCLQCTKANGGYPVRYPATYEFFGKDKKTGKLRGSCKRCTSGSNYYKPTGKPKGRPRKPRPPSREFYNRKKQCPQCKQEKNQEKFYQLANGRLDGYCIECRSIYNKQRRGLERFRRLVKQKGRVYVDRLISIGMVGELKKKYNLTEEQIMNNIDCDPEQCEKDEYGNVTANNQEGITLDDES